MATQGTSQVMVSVIMPVYNVEKYIKKAVDSVVCQSFSDFEIILVNDGSTDSSGRLCDELSEKDDRIIVIHKENGGVSSARNAAIDIARGKYLYFMDPDDYAVGELLRDNISIAEKYRCSQVVFGFVNIICDIKDDSEIKRVVYKHNMHGCYSYEEFKKVYMQHLKNVNQVVWNRIYSREFVGDTRFSKQLNTAEDAVFNMELTKKGFESIYYNNECYYVYLCRQNSLMNKYNPKRFMNEIIITDSIKSLVFGWGMGEQFEKFIAYKYVESVLSEYANMTMHDCSMTDKEIVRKIKECCDDAKISEAMKMTCAREMKSLSLWAMYLFTKNRMYRAALYFKRLIKPLSFFLHKMLSFFLKQKKEAL